MAAHTQVDGVGMSEQLLQALPTAIYTTDAAGVITFFNEAFVLLAGRRPVLGETWCMSAKLFRLDGTPLAPAQYPLSIALRERRPLHGEEVLVERGDGSQVALAAYPTPLYDDGGRLIGAVNMLLDITGPQKARRALQGLNATLEQKVLERTQSAVDAATNLQRSERNFALMVGSIVDYAVFMLDPSGIISNWNAGAARIKGYRADEIIGSHFSRFYTAEDRAAGVPDHALATATTEGRYIAEGWRVRKDGTRFWASVVIDRIMDHGKLVGFVKVTRDSTERRKAETALIESEYLARGVIDTALDGFVQLDEAGLVVQWNPRAESMFGWNRQEAMGRPLASLVVPEGARVRFAETVRAGSTGTAQAAEQIEMVNRGGGRIPVELSISSLLLNDGGRRTNIFMRDLSEKVLIEAQLRQAQKMEAVGQLTGGLAHDFNNLLQGIIGSLNLIQLRVDAGKAADVGRFVNGALSSANRAAALTHRLLAFSRRQPLDPRPVQANQLVLSMKELLQKALGERMVLTFELATDLWTTLCDPNQLESAILNLSINARDAMGEAGGHLAIRSRNVGEDELRTADKGHEASAEQYICLEVCDDGAGMPADVVDRAFEPFFTTKAPGKGTGLGLSMVYGFARQSNGFCHLDSQPGAGTSVALYLPRHARAAEDSGQSAVPAATSATAPGSGEKVLVVEDEGVVRDIVVEVLHQIGYSALEAVDGETGLALLQSGEPIHLLISDIGLPGMSGRMLANKAREMQPGLKIILMTGYAADTSAPEAFGAGMELITKPFTVEALGARLRHLLGDKST